MEVRKVVTAAIALAVIGGVATAAVGCTPQKDSSKAYQEEYLPGQPLDAVRLSAPSFAEGEYCFKVCDRTSGACWWMVKMYGEWHVLTVCEGRSYVEQQEGK